jgi:DNA primase
VEAPIDALSLATCGIPAIATIGTSFPDWLTKEIGPNKVIYFGYDNDDAGEKGVKAVDPKKLGEVGIKEASRIRPPKGCKDWNDALQELGTERLARALSGCFPLESPLPSPNRGNELEATEDVTPPAKRNVGAKIREYTEDMGVITLEYSEDVIIAGKVRKNLTWLRPDLIGIYENEDRIEAQRRELRTHARETQKQP